MRWAQLQGIAWREELSTGAGGAVAKMASAFLEVGAQTHLLFPFG